MSQFELVVLIVFAVVGAYLPGIFGLPFWAALICWGFTLIVIARAGQRHHQARRNR